MIPSAHCAYCHSPSRFLAAGLEKDHIIPISKGGTSISENLCWACHRCNQFKMNRPEMITLRLNWQDIGWKPE